MHRLVDPGRSLDFTEGLNRKSLPDPLRVFDSVIYILLFQGNVNSFLIEDKILVLLILSQHLLIRL